MPEGEENPCGERLLRNQLLLLATVVAGVTFVAGINPPGGVWQENWSGYRTGDTILLATYPRRYLVFNYCNTTALGASVVAIFLLLLEKPRRGARLVLLRIVMVLDLLGLTAAYAAGSSRGLGFTLFTSVLVNLLPVYVVIRILLSHLSHYNSPADPQEEPTRDEDELAALKRKTRRKLRMLLATLTAAITYVAGLSSSGGYWNRVEINDLFRVYLRIRVFWCFNTIVFTVSLWIVVLLVLPLSHTQPIMILASGKRSILPYVLVLGTLGAYAAGASRNTDASIYVLATSGALLVWIIIQVVFGTFSTSLPQSEEPVYQLGSTTIRRNEESRKVRFLVLLLATLVATVTYQAGLHPPGGVWPDDGEGHRAGYPILLSRQPRRYKVFLYCNSGAFVLSMAAITMLTVKKDKNHTTLLVSMILDMVALMGAYASGSWRGARSSIYVVAMACAVIIYMMIHLLRVTVLRTTEMEDTRLMKKRHKRMLMVAILVATTTYQAGLNPPGGFHEDDGYAAGTMLLMDSYPSHLWAFFHCNAVSFMGTLALILFFITPNLYRRAVRCYALYGCIVLVLFCLIAAYAAGIVKHLNTDDAYVFVLLAMVVSVVGIHTIQSRAFLLQKEEEAEEDEDRSIAVFGHVHIPRSRPRPSHIPRNSLRPRSAQETEYRQVYASHKHLMLLGILVAGATYQAGFNPPGGLLQDNGDHGSAGSPVLYHSNSKRYFAFYYTNYTSFSASVSIVALQLTTLSGKITLYVTNMILILDLMCILVAYAAGVAMGWEDAIALFVLVLFGVALHAATWIQGTLHSWSDRLVGQLLRRPTTEQS